jgi:hypothetical protein
MELISNSCGYPHDFRPTTIFHTEHIPPSQRYLFINNIYIELEKWQHVKFVGREYHLKLMRLYVRLVSVLENLQWLQKTLLQIISVVVLIQIEEIVHCAINHVIIIRP